MNVPANVQSYFAHSRRRLKSVAPQPGHRLLLEFDNGEVRLYDMSGALYGVFDFLNDEAAFNRVFIDEDGNPAWDIDPAVDSGVVWNNRVDLCSDACYMDSTPIT